MKNLKLYILSDTFFIFICLFFFFYGLFLYSDVNFILTIFLSSIITILLTAVITLTIVYLDDKKLIKKNKIKYVESLNIYLATKKQSCILQLFSTAYSKKNVEIEIRENHLISSDNNTAIYFLFNVEKTDANQIIKHLNLSDNFNKVVIYACSYTENAKKVYEYYKDKLTLFDVYDAYELLKESNLLPSENMPTLKRRTLKSIANNVFKPKNAKRFALIGIFIMLLANYSFFAVYYVVFGSIMLLTALYLRLFCKNNQI